MLQALVLGRHLLPLALARRELLQILHTLRQVGALGLALRVLRPGLGRELVQALPLAVRAAGFARQLFGAGMAVEKRSL